MIFYFLGNEDECMVGIGNGVVSTTSNSFRSTFSRCSWNVGSNDTGFAQNRKAFSASNFWFTGRVCVAGGGGVLFQGGKVLKLLDSSLINRLQIRGTANPSGSNYTCVVETVNSAGSATQLGSSFTLNVPSIGAGPLLMKLDVHINYAVSGSIDIYQNGVGTPVFSYSGDVTTNSVTSLSFFQVGCVGLLSANWSWSEFAVGDSSTLTGNVGTLVPSANGNTHNFDTGSPAASNINEITLNDLTLDGSTTAGQIDEYTIASSPAGAYVPGAVAVSSRVGIGTTGPQHVDLVLRVSGTDYFSADLAPGVSYDLFQNFWYLNPNTGAPWQSSDISAAGFNIGLKSVA